MTRRRIGLGVLLLLAIGLGWSLLAPDPEHTPEKAGAMAVSEARPRAASTPTVAVRCTDPLGLPDGDHELVELLGDGQGQLSVATVDGGEVELTVSQPSGRGGIYPVGWQPAVVSWEHGHCRFLDAPKALGAVVGVVTGGAGLPPFALNVRYGPPPVVEQNGRTTRWQYQEVDTDGGFFLELPVGVPVILAASHNGFWPNAGEEVEVVPVAGEDVVVNLALPLSVRGLGVTLEEDGAIRDVLEGTAADRARLKPGDRILSIDGEPVDPDTLPEEITRPSDDPPGRWRVVGRSGDAREVVFGP